MLFPKSAYVCVFLYVFERMRSPCFQRSISLLATKSECIFYGHFSDLQVNSYPIWLFSLFKYFGKTIFLIKSLWMFHTRPCFHYNFISTHGTKTLQRELFFSIYMAIA